MPCETFGHFSNGKCIKNDFLFYKEKVRISQLEELDDFVGLFETIRPWVRNYFIRLQTERKISETFTKQEEILSRNTGKLEMHEIQWCVYNFCLSVNFADIMFFRPIEDAGASTVLMDLGTILDGS